jgi:RNA polymerase sigma-70 factor, ECF subfamily
VEVNLSTAKAFLSGDSAATSAVYLAYRRLLYFIIVSVVKNQEDADDVFDDVFTHLLQEPPKLQDPRKLQSYLCETARHSAINFAKKRDALIDYSDLMDVYGADEKDNGYLQSLLEGLSDLEAIVFTYKIVYGFSYREISALTGVPRQSLNRLYHEAITKARRLYGATKHD